MASPLEQADPAFTPPVLAYEVPNWLEYGNGTGSTGPEGSGKVGMYANQGKYTLYDNRTGKVLAEGSSPEELKNIYDVINNTLVPQGNDADWRLYSSNPVIQTQPHRDFRDGGEGPLKLDGNPFGDVIQGYADKSTPGDPRGMVIAGDMPNSFVKDMLLPMVTPIAGAALGYFGGNALLGAMGKGAAPGLGALSNITPSSALATLQGVPIASVPTATLGGTVGGATALGAAPAAALPAGIVVSHAPLAALTGGLTTSQAAALSALAGMPAGLGGGAGATTSASSVPTTTGNEIVVQGKPPVTAPFTVKPIPPFTVPNLGTPSVPPSTPAGPETTGTEDIEVRGKPVTPPSVTVPMVVPPVNVPPVPDLGTPKVPSPNTPKSTLDKIIDYTRLGSLAVGTLGNLFGGGSGGGGQYLGTGKLDPIFSAKLPEASLPGGVSSLAARPVPEQNWYEYGFHPEQSFFNTSAPGYTPQPGKTPGMAHGGSVDYDYEAAKAAGIKPDRFGHMPDTYKLPNHMTFSNDSVYSTPEHQGGRWVQGGDGHWLFLPSEYNMQQHPMPEMEDYFRRTEQGIPGRPDSYAVYPSDYHMPGKAHGGEFAVRGPGTGRSDSIDAKLSDGEYVIDAETVALLGDGSSKAGAQKLDQFRVNLRKQKGRNLARGKFSVKAKAPEAYLAGGRT